MASKNAAAVATSVAAAATSASGAAGAAAVTSACLAAAQSTARVISSPSSAAAIAAASTTANTAYQTLSQATSNQAGDNPASVFNIAIATTDNAGSSGNPVGTPAGTATSGAISNYAPSGPAPTPYAFPNSNGQGNTATLGNSVTGMAPVITTSVQDVHQTLGVEVENNPVTIGTVTRVLLAVLVAASTALINMKKPMSNHMKWCPACTYMMHGRDKASKVATPGHRLVTGPQAFCATFSLGV